MPSILPGLIQQGAQFGLGLLASHQQQSQQSGAASREVGKAWEELIRQANIVIHGVAAKPVITQSDFEQAAAAYGALENFVSQYGTEYVKAQWASAAYQPAYNSILQQIQARVSQDAAQAAGGSASGSTGIFQGTELDLSNPWVIVAVIGLVLVLKS